MKKIENKRIYKDLRREILLQNLLILVIIGAIFNISVVVYNDSKMPVYFSDMDNVKVPDDYVVFSNMDEVNYPLFSDIFIIGGAISFIIIFQLEIINKIKRKFRRKNGTTFI